MAQKESGITVRLTQEMANKFKAYAQKKIFHRESFSKNF